jgi:leader peptidase (prepilin peptidase)/N-methyltransferase
MPHLFYIAFLFVVGACIGSFLNVVVYRLPRGISLVYPPSRCPHCETKLAWRDNVPVLGWIMLRGKCRYCSNRISPRYPIVEAITGLLFAFYYVMYFMLGVGPAGEITWPIYLLYMALISGLLAASLIDAELFIIPAGIPWWIAAVAVLVHATADNTTSAGTMIDPSWALALCSGATLGLVISIVLLQLKVLPLSFAEGNLLESERQELEERAAKASESGDEPLEVPPEYSPAEIRREIRKEMLFLMPPMALGGLSVLAFMHLPAMRAMWDAAANIDWLNAALGSILGALVAAFVVWLTRILGSYGFGKEAMGLGDVHLMLAVGAVLGAGMATVAFFLAPFAGILAGIYLWITRSRRQLPYGPYLSLATAVVMLFYQPIIDGLGLSALGPGFGQILRNIWKTFG